MQHATTHSGQDLSSCSGRRSGVSTEDQQDPTPLANGGSTSVLQIHTTLVTAAGGIDEPGPKRLIAEASASAIMNETSVRGAIDPIAPRQGLAVAADLRLGRLA